MIKAPAHRAYYHRGPAQKAGAAIAAFVRRGTSEGRITWKYTEAKCFTPHIQLPASTCGLTRDSIVLLEQIRTLDKRRLREKTGSLPPEAQQKVDQALGISVGLRTT